jgi:hypothetical protein
MSNYDLERNTTTHRVDIVDQVIKGSCPMTNRMVLRFLGRVGMRCPRISLGPMFQIAGQSRDIMSFLVVIAVLLVYSTGWVCGWIVAGLRLEATLANEKGCFSKAYHGSYTDGWLNGRSTTQLCCHCCCVDEGDL